MIDLIQARLGLVDIRGSCIRCCLNVVPQVLVVLSFNRVLGELYLGADGLVILRLSILSCLLYPMCAIGGILVLGEGGNWSVDLLLKAISVWLDLFDLRSHVGLIVWVDIRRRT